MLAANYTEFRTGLKGFLDKVELDNETLIIKRGIGNGAVLISLSAVSYTHLTLPTNREV